MNYVPFYLPRHSDHKEEVVVKFKKIRFQLSDLTAADRVTTRTTRSATRRLLTITTPEEGIHGNGLQIGKSRKKYLMRYFAWDELERHKQIDVMDQIVL